MPRFRFRKYHFFDNPEPPRNPIYLSGVTAAVVNGAFFGSRYFGGRYFGRRYFG